MSTYTVRHTPATLTANERYWVKRGDEPEMLPCADPAEALEIAAFLNEPHRAAVLSEMFWREFPGKTTLENISK